MKIRDIIDDRLFNDLAVIAGPEKIVIRTWIHEHLRSETYVAIKGLGHAHAIERYLRLSHFGVLSPVQSAAQLVGKKVAPYGLVAAERTMQAFQFMIARRQLVFRCHGIAARVS